MPTSTARPLVGSIANAGDPHYCHGWWRDEMGRRPHGSKPLPLVRTGILARAGRGIDAERRLLKRRERVLVSADVNGWDDDPHFVAWANRQTTLDEESAWLSEMDQRDALADVAGLDDECYCRRCLLHDDPGGCLRLPAPELELGEHVTAGDDRFTLNDADLPGWGTEVVWSDLHHFTVR